MPSSRLLGSKVGEDGLGLRRERGPRFSRKRSGASRQGSARGGGREEEAHPYKGNLVMSVELGLNT